MKIEGYLFAGGAVFFTLMTAIYGLWSREPIGTTALLLTAGLSGLVAFYVLFTGRRVGIRPEDRIDGEIEESAGDIGHFSPHSWWPLPTASGAALLALGLIFGWWLTAIGFGVLVIGVIGLVFEYYMGEHAH